MFELLILIIIYIVFKNKFIPNTTHSIDSKLNKLFEIQHFSNISKDTSVTGLTLINASAKGENYLFAAKSNFSQFSSTDIDTIYEKGQEAHIHNVILLSSYLPFSSNLLRKIKEYNIQIWDYKKIDSLITSPSSTSILQPSNTSDDTCKIDNNQFDPIQEPTSFWGSFFKKPDRL